VRLDKDTVTGEERVAEQVRKEQIEVQDEDGWAARASLASLDDQPNEPGQESPVPGGVPRQPLDLSPGG
jgi:hypothetical protein